MGFELTTSVVIGTDCIGSCKSNYHTITAIMAPSDDRDPISDCKESICLNCYLAAKTPNFAVLIYNIQNAVPQPPPVKFTSNKI